MQDTAGEVKMNSLAMYSCWPHSKDEKELGDQLEPIYNNSVPILDVA